MIAQGRHRSPIRRGALALLDVLGFKGLWRQHGYERILARMRILEEQAASGSALTMGFAGITLRRAGRLVMSLEPHFSMLSDTIVVAYSLEPCRLVGYQAAIQSLARVVGRIAEAGVGGEPSLAFRGCISAGEFVVEDRIILGEAVDDAAMHLDLAEAAVTWLTPKAIAKLEGIQRDRLTQSLVSHHVPLKGGRSVETLVARPVDGLGNADEQRVCASVLATIPTDRLDLMIKHQNTADVFRAMAAAPRNIAFALPALHVPGTTVYGGDELEGNGSEWFPVLMEDGSPYTGDDA